jgi:hypothetical protein
VDPTSSNPAYHPNPWMHPPYPPQHSASDTASTASAPYQPGLMAPSMAPPHGAPGGPPPQPYDGMPPPPPRGPQPGIGSYSTSQGTWPPQQAVGPTPEMAQLDSMISATHHSVEDLAQHKRQRLQLTAKRDNLIDTVIQTRQSRIGHMGMQRPADTLPAPLERKDLQAYAAWIALPSYEQNQYHDHGVGLKERFDIKPNTDEYRLMQDLCGTALELRHADDSIKACKNSLHEQIEKM